MSHSDARFASYLLPTCALALLGLQAAACNDASASYPGPEPVYKERAAASEQPRYDITSIPTGEPIVAELTSPPRVPPPTGRTKPAKVIVKLTVKELVQPIADGTMYTFWTFGGTVPGSFIRVRQGDLVEFNLQNHPTSKMPHNIDLHAVTGPGGGAASSFTAPGHASRFAFRAMNPGLYVYHCATAPVPLHVANGMYGLILVEPPQGMPPADREFYIMQGDFYTTGKYHAKGLQAFDMQKGIDESPTYVLFNGSEGAIAGEKALKARVGDRVRIYFGVGGPNLTSSFHVIGEIFDRVYFEGGARMQENVQTTMVAAGGSTIVDFKVEVPGNYAIVDHSLFRAFNKGAVGMLNVEGIEDVFLHSGKLGDSAYASADEPASEVTLPAALAPSNLTLEQQIAAGKTVYATTCAACHQATGQGMPGSVPPLARSVWIEDQGKAKVIATVLNGLTGPVRVNGQMFNSAMPPWRHLSDDDLANVISYVFNSWGNDYGRVSPAEVGAVRARSGQAL